MNNEYIWLVIKWDYDDCDIIGYFEYEYLAEEYVKKYDFKGYSIEKVPKISEHQSNWPKTITYYEASAGINNLDSAFIIYERTYTYLIDELNDYIRGLATADKIHHSVISCYSDLSPQDAKLKLDILLRDYKVGYQLNNYGQIVRAIIKND